MRRGLCVRALREAVAMLLSKNMTCARPRCNATSSKHFPHTSHCTLHTSHLISFHLVSCLPEQQTTRVMQPFQCDLQPEIPKHPITTHTHKHTQSSFKPPLHCGKKNDKPTAAATVAHTRYLSLSPAATLHGKNTRFRAPASSPKHSPCNIMQPLQCGSQH